MEVWCLRERQTELGGLLRNSSAANRFLVAYIQWLFDTRQPLAHARCAVLAAQHARRQLRGKLGRAWDSVRSWQNGVDTKTRTPILEEVLLPLCRWALACGLLLHPAEASDWIQYSIYLRLCFFGLLRPGEGASLRVADVKIGLQSGRPYAVVVAANAKNKAALGKKHMVIIDNALTVEWLRWWLVGRSSWSLVFDAGYARLRCLHRRACARLGLPGFTLGGLRAGGATTMFMRTRNMAWVKYHGRWAAERTLAHYIQEASAAAASIDIGTDKAAELERLSARLAHLDLPPAGHGGAAARAQGNRPTPKGRRHKDYGWQNGTWEVSEGGLWST